MKTVGLVGGISWTSTLDYYKRINEGINQRLGGLEFARCMIYSVNFGDIYRHTWPHAGGLLLDACRCLVAGGAEGIALCANTAHMFADEIAAKIDVPLIHIGAETANTVRRSGLERVALLGTQFTMEMDFYRDKLRSQGVEPMIPGSKSVRDYLQQTIRDELGAGIVKAETKNRYIEIVNELREGGAQGLVMGCTEIPLLIGQADFEFPVFDTVGIHTDAIVKFALDE